MEGFIFGNFFSKSNVYLLKYMEKVKVIHLSNGTLMLNYVIKNLKKIKANQCHVSPIHYISIVDDGLYCRH